VSGIDCLMVLTWFKGVLVKFQQQEGANKVDMIHY